jgi:rod shape-determining protein MreD
MTLRHPFFITFACGALLCWLVAQLNHAVAPWQMSFFVGGLLVAFPALRLSYADGWKLVVALGLWCDAVAPVRFGLHAVLFLAAHSVAFYLRGRFPREATMMGVIVAVLANTGIYLVLSVALIGRAPSILAALQPMFFDLLASGLFVAAVAPWFFALQERALEICGLSLRREQRGLL